MEKAFILIIAIGAAIFIALPFFRKRFEEASQETDTSTSNPLEEKLRRLNSEKESIYAALKELDFDHSTGKLSKDDYGELEKQYKMRAVALLKEIDNIRRETDTLELDEEIEKEIKIARGTQLTDDEEVEKEILQARKSRIEETLNLCSVCRSEYKSDDRFCSKCGVRLHV